MTKTQSPEDGTAATVSEKDNHNGKVYPSAGIIVINSMAILLALFLACLDLSIISTAIPRITQEFNSLNDVGWYSSAFFLTMSIFQTLWGKVYKYFDLKYSFVLALLIFELGTLGCAVSVNSAGFIAGRAVAGMGGAGIIGGAYTITAQMVPPARIPIFFGINGIVFTLASVLGPIIGGAFTSFVSWRWCFYINLPFGGLVIGILLLFLHLPESARPQAISWQGLARQLDIPGAIAIFGSMICYLLALQKGGITEPWSASQPIGLLVGWVVLFIVFIGIEIFQKDRALIPPQYMKNRGILLCCLFIVCFNFAIYTRLYYLPIYFQAVQGFSAQHSGVLLLANILPNSFFTLLAGGLLSKVKYYQPFLVCGAVLALIGSGLIYTLNLPWSVGKAVGYQVLVGIGDGLAVQIPVTAAQTFAPEGEAATVTATVLLFQLGSGVLGLGVGESIFTNRALREVPTDAQSVQTTQVIRGGAYDLRQIFNQTQLVGVQRAFQAGLEGVWIAIMIACACALVFSLLAAPVKVAGGATAPAVTDTTQEDEDGEDVDVGGGSKPEK